jgi:hypothetical protein
MTFYILKYIRITRFIFDVVVHTVFFDFCMYRIPQFIKVLVGKCVGDVGASPEAPSLRGLSAELTGGVEKQVV